MGRIAEYKRRPLSSSVDTGEIDRAQALGNNIASAGRQAQDYFQRKQEKENQVKTNELSLKMEADLARATTDNRKKYGANPDSGKAEYQQELETIKKNMMDAAPNGDVQERLGMVYDRAAQSVTQRNNEWGEKQSIKNMGTSVQKSIEQISVSSVALGESGSLNGLDSQLAKVDQVISPLSGIAAPHIADETKTRGRRKVARDQYESVAMTNPQEVIRALDEGLHNDILGADTVQSLRATSMRMLKANKQSKTNLAILAKKDPHKFLEKVEGQNSMGVLSVMESGPRDYVQRLAQIDAAKSKYKKAGLSDIPPFSQDEADFNSEFFNRASEEEKVQFLEKMAIMPFSQDRALRQMNVNPNAAMVSFMGTRADKRLWAAASVMKGEKGQTKIPVPQGMNSKEISENVASSDVYKLLARAQSSNPDRRANAFNANAMLDMGVNISKLTADVNGGAEMLDKNFETYESDHMLMILPKNEQINPVWLKSIGKKASGLGGRMKTDSTPGADSVEDALEIIKTNISDKDYGKTKFEAMELKQMLRQSYWKNTHDGIALFDKLTGLQIDLPEARIKYSKIYGTEN